MKPFINDEKGLDCPNCGGNNLHQSSVSVFFRDTEDSKEGKFIRCAVGYVEATNPNNNPSCRRDGLLISFECENCSADPELAIYQHKGTTYVEWHSMRMPIKGDE